MLKLEQNNSCKLVTTLHGHHASIRSLHWEAQNKWLFSGGSDKVIICWDIGGCKGAAYELSGHRNRVGSLCYSKTIRSLVSGGEDCAIISWNMEAKRQETPQWSECDNCQRCNKPFFWNFRAMYETKTIGLRQHHCRHCGKAICGDCSQRETTIPLLGFEYPVRICDECFPLISDANRRPLAKQFPARHHINCIDLNEPKSLLLSTGYDRVIALWKVNWTEMTATLR